MWVPLNIKEKFIPETTLCPKLKECLTSIYDYESDISECSGQESIALQMSSESLRLDVEKQVLEEVQKIQLLWDKLPFSIQLAISEYAMKKWHCDDEWYVLHVTKELEQNLRFLSAFEKTTNLDWLREILWVTEEMQAFAWARRKLKTKFENLLLEQEIIPYSLEVLLKKYNISPENQKSFYNIFCTNFLSELKDVIAFELTENRPWQLSESTKVTFHLKQIRITYNQIMNENKNTQ